MLPSRRVPSIGLLPYPLPGQDMVSTAGRRRVRMGLHRQGGFPFLHLRLLGPETAPSRPRMTGVGLLLGAQQLSPAVVSESGWRTLAVFPLRLSSQRASLGSGEGPSGGDSGGEIGGTAGEEWSPVISIDRVLIMVVA
eukprot:scaffold32097_cov60-Phaeocystis_antarctica.AAC.1